MSVGMVLYVHLTPSFPMMSSFLGGAAAIASRLFVFYKTFSHTRDHSLEEALDHLGGMRAPRCALQPEAIQGAGRPARFIPFIKNKVINYRDLIGIFRLSFLVNIRNINFEKMVKISQRFHANLWLYF